MTPEEHSQGMAFRLQLMRFVIIFLITVAWLAQVLGVTYFAIIDPLILDDVEKFIALIGVTGVVAVGLVMKLWPEAKD